MIIIDTSVWIEFFKYNQLIVPIIQYLLQHQQVLAVDCIFGELLQGAKNSRERDVLYAYWQNLPKVKDEGAWIDAGVYSSLNKLSTHGVGLIDSYILIVARKNQAEIWTLDKKLMSVLEEKEIFNPDVLSLP